MKMLLIFITLSFYFNAWKTKPILQTTGPPLSSSCKSVMTKTLASQIRATLGVLFKIYSYIRALQMRFKKKDNTNLSGQSEEFWWTIGLLCCKLNCSHLQNNLSSITNLPWNAAALYQERISSSTRSYLALINSLDEKTSGRCESHMALYNAGEQKAMLKEKIP